MLTTLMIYATLLASTPREPLSKMPKLKVEPFSLSEVRLKGGPFAKENEACIDYLL